MPSKSFNIHDQILNGVLEKLKKKKLYATYFFEPVNVRDYPDYLTHVKKPMALKTVKENTLDRKYDTLAELEADLLLISSNCRQYNPPQHFLQPIALEFEGDVKKLMAELREKVAKKGLDPTALLGSLVHKSEPSSKNGSIEPSAMTTPNKGGILRATISSGGTFVLRAPVEGGSLEKKEPEASLSANPESGDGKASGTTQIVAPQIPSLALSIGEMSPEEKATEYVGRNVITQLKKIKPFEMYFFGPVNTLRNPDYLKVISRPTCLRDIRDKLQSRQLKKLSEFLEELNLIVANARKYNPAGHWIHQIVNDFEISYQYYWNMWLDKLVQ
jgi:Bromodomain